MFDVEGLEEHCDALGGTKVTVEFHQEQHELGIGAVGSGILQHEHSLP